MANNMTPELLALLKSMSVGNTGSYQGEQYGSNNYAPIYAPGSYGGGGAEGGDYQPGAVTGYYGTENGVGNKGADQYNGKQRDEYDAQGNFIKSDQWSGLKGEQNLMPLMMMLAPLAMQYMGAGFGAGAGGAGGATAGSAAELALAGEGAFGATNALGGAGAFGPAGTAYYTGTGALGAAGAGGGTGFGTLPAVEVPTWSAAEFAGSQPFNWAPTAGAAGGGAAGAAGAGGGGSEAAINGLNGSDLMSDQFAANGGFGAGGFGGGTGTLASAIANGSILGGVKGLLGPAATLLGAAAGGQGQENSQTTAKDIPEWLKPSVMGLLSDTDALRKKQMAPGYMQGYDDMRSVGQGLLNQPIAGNPFTSGNKPQFGSNLLGQMYPQFNK